MTGLGVFTTDWARVADEDEARKPALGSVLLAWWAARREGWMLILADSGAADSSGVGVSSSPKTTFLPFWPSRAAEEGYIECWLGLRREVTVYRQISNLEVEGG